MYFLGVMETNSGRALQHIQNGFCTMNDIYTRIVGHKIFSSQFQLR